MRKLIILIFIFFSFGTLAETDKGTISGLFAYESGGKKIFFLKLDTTAPKGCNVTARFAFDDSKQNFQLMSSTVISAFHSKTPVRVIYNETCNTWGNAYDVRFICVGDIAC